MQINILGIFATKDITKLMYTTKISNELNKIFNWKKFEKTKILETAGCFLKGGWFQRLVKHTYERYTKRYKKKYSWLFATLWYWIIKKAFLMCTIFLSV